MTQLANDAVWPELPYAGWKDTYATLHLWTQVVGKMRLQADAVAQSFLASDALCHAARADDRADAAC